MLRIAVIAMASSPSGYAATPETIIPGPIAASRNIAPESAIANPILTRNDAVAILINAAGTLCLNKSGMRNIEIRGIEVTDDQVLIFVGTKGDRSHTFPASDLSVRVQILHGNNTGIVYFTAASDVYLAWLSPDLAKRVADALAVIKTAPSPKEQREEQSAFEAQAKSYRDAPVKPIPGEDVRRYRVQAEAAVSEKRFQDAADLYAKALSIAPWWPEGHFNEALIFGDLRQYDKAMDHMQKYLALVPNAPDARDTQDKIYAWEGDKAAWAPAGPITQ